MLGVAVVSFSGLMSIDIPAVITEFHRLLNARDTKFPEEEPFRDGSVNLDVHAIFYYKFIAQRCAFSFVACVPYFRKNMRKAPSLTKTFRFLLY